MDTLRLGQQNTMLDVVRQIRQMDQVLDRITSADVPNYEEGTFTPIFTGSTSGTANGTGKYTRIGRFVQIQINHSAALAANTLVGNVRVTGLPFTANDSHQISSLHIRGSTTGVANAAFGIINGTTLYLHSGANYGATTVYGSQPETYPATNITQNGSTVIIISWTMHYFV